MSDEPEGRTYGAKPTEDEPVNTEETFEAAAMRMILENSKAIDVVSEELAGTDRVVASINDRVAHLENGFKDHLEWASTHSHHSNFAERISELARRITSETDRLNKLRQMHHEAVDRIEALEGYPRTISGVQNSPISSAEIQRAERAFTTDAAGPDIIQLTNYQNRMNSEQRRDDLTAKIQNIQAANREAYNRGYSAGQESVTTGGRDRVLNAAIDRVKAYMIGRFPDAIIQGVVEAVNGVSTKPVSRPAWGDLVTNATATDVHLPAEDMTLTPVKDNPQA